MAKPAKAPRRRQGTPLPVFALIATLASSASFYLAGGHALFHGHADLAAKVPASSSASSFALKNISTRIDTGRGSPVFVIRGEIEAVNGAGIVPNISIGFEHSETGQRMTYTVPRGELLQANESLGFTTRIPAGTFAGFEPTVTLEGS
ncbi:MAG: hypothetical protein AAFY99_06790 [Pseudomonadota bacterium]